MALKTRTLNEIEFNAPGITIVEYLIAANVVKFRDGGSNVTYLIKRKTGGVVDSFQGSSVLNKLLHRSDVGCYVEVKYLGLDAAPVATGMSPKKLFDVGVDDEDRIDGTRPAPAPADQDGEPERDPSDPGPTF